MVTQSYLGKKRCVSVPPWQINFGAFCLGSLASLIVASSSKLTDLPAERLRQAGINLFSFSEDFAFCARLVQVFLVLAQKAKSKENKFIFSPSLGVKISDLKKRG